MSKLHGEVSVVGIDLAAGSRTTEVASLTLTGLMSKPLFDQSKYQPISSFDAIGETVVASQPIDRHCHRCTALITIVGDACIHGSHLSARYIHRDVGHPAGGQIVPPQR